MADAPQLLYSDFTRAFLHALYYVVSGWPLQFDCCEVLPCALPLLQQVQRCCSVLCADPDTAAALLGSSSSGGSSISYQQRLGDFSSLCFSEQLAQLSAAAQLVRLQASCVQHVQYMLEQMKWRQKSGLRSRKWRH
jgi:hypothetical protein